MSEACLQISLSIVCDLKDAEMIFSIRSKMGELESRSLRMYTVCHDLKVSGMCGIRTNQFEDALGYIGAWARTSAE